MYLDPLHSLCFLSGTFELDVWSTFITTNSGRIWWSLTLQLISLRKSCRHLLYNSPFGTGRLPVVPSGISHSVINRLNLTPTHFEVCIVLHLGRLFCIRAEAAALATWIPTTTPLTRIAFKNVFLGCKWSNKGGLPTSNTGNMITHGTPPLSLLIFLLSVNLDIYQGAYSATG